MKIDLHDTVRVPFYHRVSYLYIPALFVVTSVLLEVMMFVLMEITFPTYYIFTLSILLLIAALVALCRRKWLQTIICSLLLGWHVTTTIANVIANYTCMEIFSLETLKTLSLAFHSAGAVELGYWFLTPIVALVVAYIVGVVLIMWFFRTPKIKHRNFGQITLCGILAFVSFFSYTISYSSLPSYETGVDVYVTNLNNEKFLYDTFSNRVSSLRTFGSYSYYLDNLLKLVNGKSNMTNVMNVNVEDEFEANEFALPDDEVLGEGYNLIMVLMETFERAAINPITMPNLYKFMQESCVEVDGYYSIERTCFTDHIGQTGMHVEGKELWNNYGNVTVPHALANIFDRSDYVTAAFHDCTGSYYHRQDIFTKRFGFQSFNDYTTYENPKYTANFAMNSDYLLMHENLEKIAPEDENFYSYLVSVSTHAVNASYVNLGDYYPEYFAYMEEPENWAALTQFYPVLMSNNQRDVLTAKNYLAGTYSFDLGFGELLNRLKTTRGKDGRFLIETTAIVMFGDHYYYVNPFALKAENDNPRELTGNRSPFIVYNPRAKVINPETNTPTIQSDNALQNEPAKCGSTKCRFTSTMDIYPTVCSLFGIQTDKQLTYGHSIFDDAQSIGVGYLGGFTWGAQGYDGIDTETYTYQGVEYQYNKANWQIWRTLDFVDFAGVKLTKEQVEEITPLVNRTYASIHLDTWLYEKDGFKKLKKSQAYHLRRA